MKEYNFLLELEVDDEVADSKIKSGRRKIKYKAIVSDATEESIRRKSLATIKVAV